MRSNFTVFRVQLAHKYRMVVIVSQRFVFLIVLLTIMLVGSAYAADEQYKGLDTQVQSLKSDVIQLNRELQQLEEKLLFPSSSQVSLFVSLESLGDFQLDAVRLYIDGKLVTNHLYTFRELEALKSGAVQRLYTGNISGGKHAVKLDLLGQEGDKKGFRQASYSLTKGVGPSLLEMRISEGPNVAFIPQ